ncbi:MAG: hypothetical protein ACYCSO_10500 [Cuniculiplasma sp.]
MSKTLFLEDVFGENWQSEVPEDARIEPRAGVVRGLTPSRYLQLWELFPAEQNTDVLLCLSQGHGVERTAALVGLSPRQVKNAITAFLSMAKAAYEQPSFLPRPIATNINVERRPRSRRGRPPKGQRPLVKQENRQVALPF